MLLTLGLKTWRLSILTGSDQVKSVMFMTGWFPFKYSWLVYLLPDKIDSYSIGQDGKCLQ